MFYGKMLRSKIGAISNVSGAIGLFLREDIDLQKTVHSGQFGGEDQQRTMFSHIMKSQSSKHVKGVTFFNSTVYTDAPDTLKAFLKQRSFSWGMATHETFFIALKVIASDKTHFLLKLDRAYLIFIFLTEPIRMALFPLAVMQPEIIMTLILTYFVLENLSWIRLRKYIPYWVVILSPLFNIIKIITRFVAYFYWFKVKYHYLKKETHKVIVSRKLVFEYLSVLTLASITCFSLLYFFFFKEMNTLF